MIYVLLYEIYLSLQVQPTFLCLLVPIPLELDLLIVFFRFVWAVLHDFAKLVLNELFLAFRNIQFLLQIGNLGAIFLRLWNQRLPTITGSIELAGYV